MTHCGENGADDLPRREVISPDDEIVRGAIGNVNAVVFLVPRSLARGTFAELGSGRSRGVAITFPESRNAGAF